MVERRFPITTQQWSRFVDSINPTLAELLTAGLLNGIVDDVEFVGGNRKDDLRCRVADRLFTVEAKTAWWHDAEQTTVGHSPLRPTQHPDLVALVGRFDVSESAPTLKSLDDSGLAVEADRLFYLVPKFVVREHSRADGRSTARALIPVEAVHDYSVDLVQGISKARVLSLLEG